jgi:hypothetical protein
VAVATFGLLDLSIVTDALGGLLTDCIANSPLFVPNNGNTEPYDITPTGDPPDVVRAKAGTFLSLYLFHVNEDPHQKNAINSNPNGGFPRAQRIPRQPLALDLHYLLTAYSTDGYVKEQQAMSIALRCFHEHQFVTTTVPFGPANPEQFTLGLEVQSIDDASRLWQATTTPIRLSALYRVGVVFLSPDAPPPPGPPVTHLNLLGGAALVPFATAGGQLTGTRTTVTYRPPNSTAANPISRSYDLSPATVTAGSTFELIGGGLAGSNVYLEGPAGGEVDVTAWLVPNPALQSDSRLTLRLPAQVGLPPAGSPDPGFYHLRVGAGAVRSNSAPLPIAARVDNVGNPPLLNPAAGVYSVQGEGFTQPAMVVLGTIALTSNQAAPGAGEFRIAAAGDRIDFRAPAGLAAGQYPLRIRIEGVESPPSWWVDVP